MQLFGMTSAEHKLTLNQSELDECLYQIALGEKSALAELFDATKASVYGFVLSIVRNAFDAEDVLQETYVKIWSAAEGYSSQGKPMAWILTIAKNLATSVLRERNKTAELPEDDRQGCYAESPGLSCEEKMVLTAAMQQLSLPERQIVMLHAVSGLKHIEIAQLMSLPLSTVLSKYSRAKKKLQAGLKEGN